MNVRDVRQTAIRLGVLAAAALAAAAAVAQETVVVPSRVIYPGETIAADSLDEVALRRQLRNPASIAFAVEQIEGKVARRTLLPGRLISVSSVREAYLVEPGTPVQVEFVHGGLTIAVAGVPLEAGAIGDLIKVRNIDSGAVFTGIVMADGTIRVSAS